MTRCFERLGQIKFSRKSVAIGLILLVTCLLVGAHFLKSTALPDNSQPLVILEKVSKKSMPIEISSFGNLVAPISTMLKSQQAGVVKQINFINGQKVHKGDLLVQLDDAGNQALYNKDKAVFSDAKNQYERYLKLEKIDPAVISKTQFDQVYSQYESAKSTLDNDEKNILDMKINAPFDGVLAATNIAVGSFVDVGDDIVFIVRPDDLEITYPVTEANFSLIKLQQKVKFTVDAYPEKIFTATVVYKDPFINPNNRSFNVRAKVDNPDGLVPGLLINVKHLIAINQPVLMVRTDALVSEMAGFSVYQVNNGKVIKTYVKTGRQSGDFIEIKNGLKNNAEIITQGIEKVQPGMLVKVERL